jgi:hypothetical protein
MGWAKAILSADMDRRIDQNAARRGKYNGDLEALAKEWAKKTATQLKKNIQSKGLTVTQDLLDSITYGLRDGGNPSIVISFAAHGRFLDMKQLFWSKQPPVDVIEAWVKRKGLNAFAFVPGYGVSNSNALNTAPNAARRIAFGIAKSLNSGEVTNQYGKWQRKKVWQNPSGKTGAGNLGTAIGHLRHLLEEEFASSSENILVHSITYK